MPILPSNTSFQYIWDTVSLQWVRQTQSTAAPGASDVNIAADSVGLARYLQLPVSLGQKPMTGSTSVTIASDQSPLPVITSAGTGTYVYDEALGLTSGPNQVILSFTVLVSSELRHVQCSGTNIADYIVQIDGATIAKRRTYFTEYNTDFHFEADPGSGFALSPGQVVEVLITHTRPSAGDFNATLTLTEI